MPCDYKKYPADWLTVIRPRILKRAGNRCEGSPRYPGCRAEQYKPHPVTGSKVVLTIAHMDHDITNNEDDNLRALCQYCHLTHDKEQHAQKRKSRKCNYDWQNPNQNPWLLSGEELEHAIKKRRY